MYKIFFIFLFFLIKATGFTQDVYYNTNKIYDQFCKKAVSQEFDSAMYYFNKWISIEKDLDSIQRVFIDTDLEYIKNSDYFKVINNSLHQIYFAKYNLIKEKELSYRLWELGAIDQKFRTLHKFNKKKNFPKVNTPEFFKQNEIYSKIIKEYENEVLIFIKKYGWTTYSLVGEHGAKAAFLVIQHSDKNKMKYCLPILKKAVEEKEANPYYYAMMLDRYLMQNNKKQLYGTQLKCKTEVVNGELIIKENYLYSIKDEPNINKRRAELGLKPLEEELKAKWGIDYVVPLK